MIRLEQKYASRAQIALKPARPAATALSTRLHARPLMTTSPPVERKSSPRRDESRLYPTEGSVQYSPPDTSNPAML